MTGRPTEERVQSFLDTMAMPTKRRLLRQEPWQPIMQQFICGAIGFSLALSNPRPNPWPLRSDCDLQRLSSARVPVLTIIGRAESLVDGPKTATRLRQQLPEARVELVDDANHMVFIDQTEIVEKLLAEFLQ
ncbi:alpha/beta hydrolase [Mycolicibacterium flavescens]|uniref:AB hydrolase-1 domain-containing protein n=1 Tax=Mycolicibacterium flavescens TaxID=1776 RepID=A0A1E3RBM2_MYCFV|nr:alpha/beta hydrolase [Mycolicibacterium flavescens]MCV7278659.1 alpha/beta hydrolase [Mycolicibacterium flavescens]ODQ87296.1 hypothetical protein BHQ18_24300 [Mycolicibacterium flavescens]